MKRIIILIFISCFLLSSCDPYVNKYPTHYKNSQWVCENPNITYNVGDFKNNIGDCAETVIDQKTYYFGFGFMATTADGIKYALDENGDIIDTGEHYFFGTGKYSEKEFTITIDKESDSLFDGEYDKLVFQRVY